MQSVALGKFILEGGGSVDPSRHPDEDFDLYSIPAYDNRTPDVLKGRDIGSSKKVVESGDVLLSRIVPHIRRAWVVGTSNGRRQIASGEWIVFRSQEFDTDYLRNWLLGDVFHQQFMMTVSGVGGSLLRARPSEVAKITIPLPEIREQKRIATILDKADAIRRKRQQAIQLADEFLRSVFLDMFGDVYSNPKKWPRKALGDWADILTGYAFPSDHFVDEGNDAIRLCRGANVLPGQLEWSDTEWWPISDTEALSRFQLSEGDVILALDRPWISAGLKVAQVSNDDLPSLLVQRVARIRGRTRAESLFFFFAIDSAAFTRHCKPTETTIPHISPIELRAYMVPRPPDALLDDFYQAANISLRQNNLMGRALDEAEHLFSSCCQRAFRGEL